MSGLSLILLLVLAGCVAVLLRWHEYQRWHGSLIGYRLRLPVTITPEVVGDWLASLATVTHPPRFLTPKVRAVVVEIHATRTGIEYQLWVPEAVKSDVLAGLRAALPGARLDELPATAALARGTAVAASSLQQVGRDRQLAIERAETVSRGLLAALQPLHGSETICWQWVLTGSSNTGLSGERLEQLDARARQAVIAKHKRPLLNAAGRVYVSAASTERTGTLLRRVAAPLRQLSLPGVSITRAWWPSPWVASVVLRRMPPVLGWLLLNSAELASMLALPFGDALPGVPAPVARTLPPEQRAAAGATVLADSNYAGSAAVPLGIGRRERLAHVWITAPTDSGKSWLQTGMALQDAARGDGLCFVDPKGDAIEDFLRRLPSDRHADVTVIDPSDTSRPVGFNILAAGNSAVEKELVVDTVVHTLRQQWAKYWGPRTDLLLRMALLSLTHTKASDGTAFTICEAAEVLTSKRFRYALLKQGTIPEAVAAQLRWFDSLGDAQQAHISGAVLNKLWALSTQTVTRRLLGQSGGLDLKAAVRENKIVLVPLRAGLIGAEAASLIGCLFVAGMWHATQSRAGIPAEKRRPYWLYLDEAQTTVRLPTVDMADMLAQARGLGVGVVGANQYLAQLPEHVRRAVLSTVRSHVVFQLNPDDAKAFTPIFSPSLNAADLQHLGDHEVAMRLADGNHTGRPVTGTTRPLPTPTVNADALRAALRERDGLASDDVDTALRTRTGTSKTTPPDAPAYGSRKLATDDEVTP
ncbi:type IV secretory system conjugative DNA transfer family protein [Mycobacteroides abscessus]|uniref:type IV secretory system conjugative DNA transfer family protein n=1 Tax=Mycobacteroides abscessus TaxID=36809 RepID=UPI000D919733|nr:type IV secretory system conjugative DNA transfer family protein [Mycobacteroides abscessus]SPX87805.1 Type IV secretory pathway, VirD4 components [Mycobacteroides abscessus]